MRKGCTSGPVFGKQEANAALRLCVQLGMIVMPAAAAAAAARAYALERRMDDFAQQHEARQRAIEDGLRLQHERIDALQVHHPSAYIGLPRPGTRLSRGQRIGVGLRQMRAGVGDEMLRERWRHAGDGRPAARADDSLECAADSSMLSEVARPHLHRD